MNFWSGSLQETFLLCLFWQAESFQEFLGNASFFVGYYVSFFKLAILYCVSMYLCIFSSRKFLRKQPSSLQVMMLLRKRTISKVLLNSRIWTLTKYYIVSFCPKHFWILSLKFCTRRNEDCIYHCWHHMTHSSVLCNYFLFQL